MGTPRYGHTAVRLLDGRVLVVGGAGGESDPSTAELYDPESGTWSASGSMLRFLDGFGPRCCATARCSSGMSRTIRWTTGPTGSPGQRCTTRRAGRGPSPGRWSSTTRAPPRCCATAQCSCLVKTAPSCTTQRPGTGPPRGRWSRRGMAAAHPSCCPMAGCSWQAASGSSTMHWTRPSSTIRPPGPGPRPRACMSQRARPGSPSCRMARCS